MRLRNPIMLTVLAAAIVSLATNAADAHFPWIVAKDGKAFVYFGELAEPDDPDLLKNLNGLKLVERAADGKTMEHELVVDDQALVAKAKLSDKSPAWSFDFTYGVLTRGKSSFLLRYYGKTFSSSNPSDWKPTSASRKLDFEIIPDLAGDTLKLQVLWKGKPAADTQVKASGPGLDETELQTDADGQVTLKLAGNGLYSIRARHVEAEAGELKGESYQDSRHYSTLVLPFASAKTSTP